MFSDDVPATSTSAAVSGEGLRDDVVAELANRGDGLVGRRVAASGDREHRGLAVVGSATAPSPKRASAPSRDCSVGQRRGRVRVDAPPVTTISTGSVVMPGKSLSSATKPCFETKRSGRLVTAARPDLHAEHGRGEEQEERGREGEAQARAPQDAPDDRAPEPSLGILGLERLLAEERDAQRVHAVPEQPEQRGKQRRRRGDRDDPDEDRPDGEAAHDRVRHEQHPEHRDDERRAAEDDGAVRGAAGRGDRVGLLESLRPFLAVARDDEERVVDPEREAHPREHVHDEDRELELLREDRGEPERDDDRDDRHQQRDEPGDDGAEDEQQDDQRRREPELQLALLEILLREQVEVVVERRSPAIVTSKAESSLAASSSSMTPAVSSSSRIAIETSVACRSAETAASLGSVR